MYIKQTNLTNCGPVAIFNIFKHFGVKPPSLKSIATDILWKKRFGLTDLKTTRSYLRNHGFSVSRNSLKRHSLDSVLKQGKVVILGFVCPDRVSKHLVLIVAKHNGSYLTVNYSGLKKTANVKYLSKDLIQYLVEQDTESAVVGIKT